MKPITTRGPAQAATRNGNSGDWRQGAEITGALLAAATRPDPEVAEKPQRRRFTAEYKVRILRDADACAVPGEIGGLLRREGLYSSHLTEWRRQREQGALAGLAPKKRCPSPKARPSRVVDPCAWAGPTGPESGGRLVRSGAVSRRRRHGAVDLTGGGWRRRDGWIAWA